MQTKECKIWQDAAAQRSVAVRDVARRWVSPLALAKYDDDFDKWFAAELLPFIEAAS